MFKILNELTVVLKYHVPIFFISHNSLGMDVFTEIISMFEDHYPETLKKTFIVNGK